MSILLNGFVLGWSVAWPPGPVNAEMIRRGLRQQNRGGFWSTWSVGLGACTSDFIWALGVSFGAGAFLSSVAVRRALGIVSFVLLLVLAITFARSAWRIYRNHRASDETIGCDDKPKRSGYWLGLLFALTSPWNIGFWFAVVGSQAMQTAGLERSIALAGSVVLGALTWTLVLSTALKFGARIFARLEWQIMTEVLTSVVMLWFAVRLVLHFP
jgi:threonine/homoserine/homoserine lactone efflux protein